MTYYPHLLKKGCPWMSTLRKWTQFQRENISRMRKKIFIKLVAKLNLVCLRNWSLTKFERAMRITMINLMKREILKILKSIYQLSLPFITKENPIKIYWKLTPRLKIHSVIAEGLELDTNQTVPSII